MLREVDIVQEINISLDLGNGLHTTEDEDKLSVNYEPNGNMHIEESDDPNETGLYVEDLNGEDGQDGGSTYDNWTTRQGTGWLVSDTSVTTQDFIDINREVINLIFTFGLYKPQMRHPTTIAYDTSVKDVQSICNEIVAPIYWNNRSYTSYRPSAGEMIQLVTNPTFRTVSWNGSTIACETLNRAIGQSQEVKVMFVIMEIHYDSDIHQGGSEYWVNDMKLCCIYSSIPDYVVGTTYTGTQGFDLNHI